MPLLLELSSQTIETLKVLVPILIPVTVVIIGYLLNERLKTFEHFQWRNQKLIEKRITIYDQLAPLLNDLLCYYTYIGTWKEITPIDILNKKREIDRRVNIARHLFPHDFYTTCEAFMNSCFQMFNEMGEDAKLNDRDFEPRQKVMGEKWDPAWNNRFSGKVTPKEEIKTKYYDIMKAFERDMGLVK